MVQVMFEEDDELTTLDAYIIRDRRFAFFVYRPHLPLQRFMELVTRAAFDMYSAATQVDEMCVQLYNDEDTLSNYGSVV